MQPWTQNCGVRRLPLDFRDQYFGCEIELTGINRATAAQTLADLFGTRAEHSGGGYDAYRVKDLDGKEWKIVRDGSIHPECRRRSVLIGETYKVELNSPKLEYGEMEKLQEVVRSLRRAGGIVNDSWAYRNFTCYISDDPAKGCDGAGGLRYDTPYDPYAGRSKIPFRIPGIYDRRAAGG